MNCLLCLESINNFMDCIHVNSEMWKKQNMKYLIEKHLWPMNTIKFYSSVCSNCGQELFTFHTFYKRIEKAHTNMSIMVKTDNEMEDIGTNNSNYTTLDSKEELVSKVISSDHFNDSSSLDIKDNDDYMECSTEPEILQEQLISEKVMLRQPTNESFFKETSNSSSEEDNSNLISSDDQEVEKGTQNEGEDSLRKNKKQLNDAGNMTDTLRQPTNKNFFKQKNNPSSIEDNSNLISSDDQDVEKPITAQHTKSDFFIRKIDTNNRKETNKEYDRIIAEDKSELLKCEQCDKGFTTPSKLKRHIRKVHENKFVKICEICGKSIRCPSFFVQHVKNHETTAAHVSCDICGKLYVNEKGLRIHKKQQHPEGGKKYLKCDVCGQLLFSTLSLKRHKLSQHPEGGKKEQICHICSKVSVNSIALKEHIIAVHEKGYKYKCTMCERAFTRPRFLKEHLARHTGTALYTCTWCPKTFTASGNKYLHHKNAHPEEWQEHLRQRNAKKFNK